MIFCRVNNDKRKYIKIGQNSKKAFPNPKSKAAPIIRNGFTGFWLFSVGADIIRPFCAFVGRGRTISARFARRGRRNAAPTQFITLIYIY
jgi:hypothetical protein